MANNRAIRSNFNAAKIGRKEKPARPTPPQARPRPEIQRKSNDLVRNVRCIVLTVMIYVLPSIIEKFNSYLTRGHQLSVIKELEEWGDNYSQIKTSQEAQKATEMLAYLEKYYVPSDGYRSDANTEQKLERQREHTIRRITDALEEYSARIGSNAKADNSLRESIDGPRSSSPPTDTPAPP